MIYRRALPEDEKDLQLLGLISYGQLKPFLSDFNWEKMKAVLLSEKTFPEMLHTSFGFVAAEESRLLGMAFLVPSGKPTGIYSAETSIIRMVGVDPAVTGRGIAQQLTRNCIGMAQQQGEKKISLHSAEIMYAARHIYEKCGFKKIRLLDEHYGLAYWLYEMKLEG